MRRTILLFAAMSLALLPVSPVWADDEGREPWLEVSLSYMYVAGCAFAVNDSVDVVVKDTDGTTELFSGSELTDGDGCFETLFSFDLLPGMFVSVSDESVTRELTLVTLSIDVINPETDTASGTAPPNTTFNVDTDVCPDDCQTWVSAYPVVSDGAGVWTADFGALGVDLVTGEDLGADIYDEAFTVATVFDRNVPPDGQDLMDEVTALVGGPQGKSLIQKLQTVEQQLGRDKITSAIAALRAYVRQVEGLVRAKQLSSDAGEQLIYSANTLILGLGG